MVPAPKYAPTWLTPARHATIAATNIKFNGYVARRQALLRCGRAPHTACQGLQVHSTQLQVQCLQPMPGSYSRSWCSAAAPVHICNIA